MTFATLNHIHKLLEEDKRKKEELFEDARYNRSEAQKTLDDLNDYASNPTDAEIRAATKSLEMLEEHYQNARTAYNQAREAMEEFLDQDFR